MKKDVLFTIGLGIISMVTTVVLHKKAKIVRMQRQLQEIDIQEAEVVEESEPSA